MTVLTEHTILPSAVNEGAQQLADLVSALAGDTELSLLTASGRRFALSDQLREALLHAVRALGAGQAVTLEPRSVVLSTQEAADLLGISRPTFVKLLETGEIVYTQPGRHRRVLLRDVLDYQERLRSNRRVQLADMSEEAAVDDAYGRINGFTETR